MKLLLHVLWLLLGLIYRLVVLVLFERWIPFPERAPAEPPPEHAPRPRLEGRREPRAQGLPGPFAGEARAEPSPPAAGRAPPRPIFELRGGEPPAELVATLESQHLAPRPQRAIERPRGPRAAGGRGLRALLRDKRALAGAIVLGEALRPRRPVPK